MRTKEKMLLLAQKNAKEYQQFPNIKAIIVTGSLAVGEIDEVSDIDTIIYVDPPCSPEFFTSECKKATDSGGALHSGTPEDFGVYRYVEGIRCDFGFNGVSQMEQIISDVLDNLDTDLTKQLILRGVNQAIPLYGEEIVEGWKQRMAVYPEALAVAMLKKYFAVSPLEVFEKMALQRNDLFFFYEYLANTHKNLFAVLFALNHEYNPGKLKGIREIVESLSIAPENIYQRLQNLLVIKPEQAPRELRQIIDEIAKLVQKHYPQIDVDAFYRHLHRKI